MADQGVSIIDADFDATIRTLIFTGRPLRTFSTPYIADWEQNRQAEIRELTAKGLIPLDEEIERLDREGKLTEEIENQSVKW